MTDVAPFISFGELLKHLRLLTGLTQQQFGQAVGYSHTQVGRLENGKRLPDVAVVRARFVTALNLQSDPATAARLIKLAAAAHADIQPGLPIESATTEPRSQTPNNLPLQVTSFIGREHDLAELKTLLPTTQLLTLTGSGGVGKTRLAMQLAMEEFDAYPGGVWLVDLAPLTDPALVPQKIAVVLGVQEAHDSEVMLTLLTVLSRHERHMLLILDNCEHIIDACAHFATAALQSCRNLRIIATSREALSIAGEQVWRVPSLQFPLHDEQAMRLAGAAAVFEGETRLLEPNAQIDFKRIVASARARLDDPVMATAWTEGQRMTLDQAVACALQGGEVDIPPIR